MRACVGVNGRGGLEGSTTLTDTRRFNTDCTKATADTTQWLRSLSFDAARGHLLMMSGTEQHDDDSSFSLVSAPACHQCHDNGTDIRPFFVDAQTSPPHFKVALSLSPRLVHGRYLRQISIDQSINQSIFIGPILWCHSGPLCHALSLLLSLALSSWTSMRRRRATATPGEWACGEVANWPNIFQMLLVCHEQFNKTNDTSNLTG